MAATVPLGTRPIIADIHRRILAFARAVARFAGRRGVAAVVLIALGALLEGVGILLLVPLLAVLLDSSVGLGASALTTWAARFSPDLAPAQRLGLILAVFAGIMALRALVLWRRDGLLGRLQVGFVEGQRVAIARRLAAARWEALARLGHGRITHLLGGDIQRCGVGAHFLLQSAVAVVMLTVQIGLAFALSPPLTALAVGLMVIGALALSSLLRRSHDAGEMVTQASRALLTGLGRFLGDMKTAMSQNLQDDFVAAFERELDNSARRQAAFADQQAMLRGLWGLLAACVAGGTMLIGYAALQLSPPVLLALLVLLARISAPASQIHLGIQQIAYSLPMWEALQAMDRELAAAAAPVVRDAAQADLAGPIEFSDVHYRHDGPEAGSGGGLSGLTLRLEPGEWIGVTGASGAGKTTFVDLLAGLLAPQSGRITIGGVPLAGVQAERWRDRIAYVAQDAALFNDTLRANLSWANPAADDDAIAAALALVGADGLIDRLPFGLDNVVGERGALISGGERQRLALARALLRAPSLMILDEATSAIDIAAEQEILARLAALVPRPTVVMIAHRHESLAGCERLLTLADGRLANDERRVPPRIGKRRVGMPA